MRYHLGIRKDAWPFPESQVGGHQHRSALVEAVDEVEEELATGLGERQISQVHRE
jgi:hypothetical protein